MQVFAGRGPKLGDSIRWAWECQPCCHKERDLLSGTGVALDMALSPDCDPARQFGARCCNKARFALKPLLLWASECRSGRR